MFLCLKSLIDMVLYTFIFEIVWRDSKTGQFKPSEYRKKNQMSIAAARSYSRRLGWLFLRLWCELFYHHGAPSLRAPRC